MQVSGGDIAHQRGDYGLAVLFRAQQIRAGRLRGAAKPSPDIYFERKKTQRRLAKIAVLRRLERDRQRRLAAARQAREFETPAGAELWELVRACNAETGARFFDTSHGVAQIVVRRQRRANQVLEF